MREFFKVMLYVTLMVSFISAVALCMTLGLWYIGVPLFIIGLSALITLMDR